eukprot:gene18161-24592_t
MDPSLESIKNLLGDSTELALTKFISNLGILNHDRQMDMQQRNLLKFGILNVVSSVQRAFDLAVQREINPLLSSSRPPHYSSGQILPQFSSGQFRSPHQPTSQQPLQYIGGDVANMQQMVGNPLQSKLPAAQHRNPNFGLWPNGSNILQQQIDPDSCYRMANDSDNTDLAAMLSAAVNGTQSNARTPDIMSQHFSQHDSFHSNSSSIHSAPNNPGALEAICHIPYNELPLSSVSSYVTPYCSQMMATDQATQLQNNQAFRLQDHDVLQMMEASVESFRRMSMYGSSMVGGQHMSGASLADLSQSQLQTTGMLMGDNGVPEGGATMLGGARHSQQSQRFTVHPGEIIPPHFGVLPTTVQIKIVLFCRSNPGLNLQLADFDDKVVYKLAYMSECYGEQECINMLEKLGARLRTKQTLIKNGAGYLDVAMTCHLDMLKADPSGQPAAISDYARLTLPEGSYTELCKAVESSHWLAWEHFDQGIVHLLKKLPEEVVAQKLQDLSNRTLHNVRNITDCVGSFYPAAWAILQANVDQSAPHPEL